MLTKLKVAGFTAVPQLESTALMRHHGGEISFSTTKPNVIIGPNGAGKSSLLQAIAIRFLADLLGHSALARRYVDDHEYGQAWSKQSGWEHKHPWVFLKGLECETDEGLALYFRPAHIPGNEHWINTAMMLGYSRESKRYRELTENRSSGQQGSALLQRMCDALDGEGIAQAIDTSHWSYGLDARDLPYDAMPWVKQAEVLKDQVRARKADALPLVLLDEPEQSLDCRAEAQLWQRLANTRCDQVQVIVATHSVHPLLNPERFNLISAEAGYADSCLEAMGLVGRVS